MQEYRFTSTFLKCQNDNPHCRGDDIEQYGAKHHSAISLKREIFIYFDHLRTVDFLVILQALLTVKNGFLGSQNVCGRSVGRPVGRSVVAKTFLSGVDFMKHRFAVQ